MAPAHPISHLRMRNKMYDDRPSHKNLHTLPSFHRQRSPSSVAPAFQTTLFYSEKDAVNPLVMQLVSRHRTAPVRSGSSKPLETLHVDRDSVSGYRTTDRLSCPPARKICSVSLSNIPYGVRHRVSPIGNTNPPNRARFPHRPVALLF